MSYKLSRGKRAVLLGRLETVERSIQQRTAEEATEVRVYLLSGLARTLGSQARRAGDTTQACPYAGPTRLRFAWLAGWREENVRLKGRLIR